MLKHVTSPTGTITRGLLTWERRHYQRHGHCVLSGFLAHANHELGALRTKCRLRNSPARVSISSSFGDFGGGFSWLADPNLPIGQGSVTTEFIGEVTGRYVLTGGSGAVILTDLFPSPPDIVYHPALYLDGQPTDNFSLHVEFGVPFTVRAVFNFKETRTANYRNFTHYAYDFSNNEVQVLQNGNVIPRGSRELVALADVPEPSTVLCLGAGLLVVAFRNRALRSHRK